MKAKDIMTRPVVTVTPQTPVQDAVRLMLEHHISGLPVIDESGELVGIVTEADLLLKETQPKPQQPVVDWFGRSLWLERWLSGYRKVKGRIVGEVMTHNVVTAGEDTPAHELASLMTRFQVNRLPIVRGRQVVGIVTRADILKLFLRSDEILRQEAQLAMKDFLLPTEEVEVSADRGVLALRGRVASPGRRFALLRRLWEIDGVISIDERDLEHAFREMAGVWE